MGSRKSFDHLHLVLAVRPNTGFCCALERHQFPLMAQSDITCTVIKYRVSPRTPFEDSIRSLMSLCEVLQVPCSNPKPAGEPTKAIPFSEDRAEFLKAIFAELDIFLTDHFDDASREFWILWKQWELGANPIKCERTHLATQRRNRYVSGTW